MAAGSDAQAAKVDPSVMGLLLLLPNLLLLLLLLLLAAAPSLTHEDAQRTDRLCGPQPRSLVGAS